MVESIFLSVSLFKWCEGLSLFCPVSISKKPLTAQQRLAGFRWLELICGTGPKGFDDSFKNFVPWCQRPLPSSFVIVVGAFWDVLVRAGGSPCQAHHCSTLRAFGERFAMLRAMLQSPCSRDAAPGAMGDFWRLLAPSGRSTCRQFPAILETAEGPDG